LVLIVALTMSLFFLSSWTNAMVVGGKESFTGAEELRLISPLIAGFLAVVAIGFLVRVVFD